MKEGYGIRIDKSTGVGGGICVAISRQPYGYKRHASSFFVYNSNLLVKFLHRCDQVEYHESMYSNISGTGSDVAWDILARNPSVVISDLQIIS